jgi:serine/threonine protein kinase
MHTIEMSKKEFQNLELLQIPSNVLNTEGIIYEMKYKNCDKVLKSLYNLNGPIFANKLYTLEMLSTSKKYLPKSFYIPDSLISVANEIVGFTIPKYEGIALSVLLQNKDISTGEKIFYLKQVGAILEQLKNIRTYTPLKEFYLNDLHESNFLINPLNKEIAVIDLDSSKIFNNLPFASRYLTPLSLASYTPEKYIVNPIADFGSYIVADEDTDLYCYSIMVLNYLYGSNVNNFSLEEFYEYLNYLRHVGVNKKLIDIFSDLVLPKHNTNPLYCLDSLTDEQVYRASSLIYKKVKK